MWWGVLKKPSAVLGFMLDFSPAERVWLRPHCYLAGRPAYWQSKHKVMAVFGVVCCRNVVIRSHSMMLIASWHHDWHIWIHEQTSHPNKENLATFRKQVKRWAMRKVAVKGWLALGQSLRPWLQLSFSAEPKQLHRIKLGPGSIRPPGNKGSLQSTSWNIIWSEHVQSTEASQPMCRGRISYRQTMAVTTSAVSALGSVYFQHLPSQRGSYGHNISSREATKWPSLNLGLRTAMQLAQTQSGSTLIILTDNDG